MLYKLDTVGLLDASLHSVDEVGLIFEHPANSVFNQLLRTLAIGKGHLLEPRFNIGREMYFHAFQGTRKPAFRQLGERDTAGPALGLTSYLKRCRVG